MREVPGSTPVMSIFDITFLFLLLLVYLVGKMNCRSVKNALAEVATNLKVMKLHVLASQTLLCSV